ESGAGIEADISSALESAGLTLVPRWGASAYRVDVAVEDARQPGHFVLAVEADGASYRSARTARDRDRIRREQLEYRGWKYVRIWAADWFSNREAEIARVRAAYDEALAPPPPPPPIEPPPVAAPVAVGASPADSALEP